MTSPSVGTSDLQRPPCATGRAVSTTSHGTSTMNDDLRVPEKHALRQHIGPSAAKENASTVCAATCQTVLHVWLELSWHTHCCGLMHSYNALHTKQAHAAERQSCLEISPGMAERLEAPEGLPGPPTNMLSICQSAPGLCISQFCSRPLFIATAVGAACILCGSSGDDLATCTDESAESC